MADDSEISATGVLGYASSSEALLLLVVLLLLRLLPTALLSTLESSMKLISLSANGELVLCTRDVDVDVDVDVDDVDVDVDVAVEVGVALGRSQVRRSCSGA